MEKVNEEITLIKYDKKTWWKSALLGFIIGLAVIVPGISGAAVAIIFKLYDQFLYAVGNLFKKFKACFAFLLPIGLGLIVGFLVGLLGVQKLLDWNLFAVVCLFAGLMVGAFPAVKSEIKGAKPDAKRVILFLVGVCIPVALGCVSAVIAAKTPKTLQITEGVSTMFDFVQPWHIIVAVLIGYAVGITQIVPGLSASALLMAIGWYKSLMQSVSFSYITGNPKVLLVYAGLGVGFLAGLFTFSKLLTFIFGRARQTAYYAIVGLSLGSILSMFCNGDIIAVYIGWATGGIPPTEIWLSVGLGVALFALGVFLAYRLVKIESKKENKE